MARSEQGYTLAELMVVILIFSVVTTIITVSFNRIVASSAQVLKATETDIGGLIGLELLRCDLDLAGFGLPWALPPGLSYGEASASVLVAGCSDGCPGAMASLFNDAPAGVPRAYLSGHQAGLNGSDYLVLKGTALGMSGTSRSWSYLTYSSGGAVIKPSKSEVELKPGSAERVIVLRAGASAGEVTRELVTNGPGSNFTLSLDLPIPAAFLPAGKGDSNLMYGVAPADPDGLSLDFPFNRADYYLSRDDNTSANCAPGTGTLYKAILNHNDKRPIKYPILDCAADLQVVFYLDTSGSGNTDLHTCDLSTLTDSSARALRQQLNEIRVYILAQQGKKDRDFSYPVTDPLHTIVVGDPALNQALGAVYGSVWSQQALARTMGSDWRHYRWKVYTIAVQPKNL